MGVKPSLDRQDKGSSGRDIFLQGPHSALDMGILVGAALGLPTTSVLHDASTAEQEDASWVTGGQIRVHELAPGSDLPVKLDIDLFAATIDTDCFTALARSQGLTIAWSVDEAAAGDMHYFVAYPNGAVLVHLLSFEETSDAYLVQLGPALHAA